ncbi:MAG: transposase [Bacteroidota bacterium]|nr:transposase [Bacteroidota bacterium]
MSAAEDHITKEEGVPYFVTLSVVDWVDIFIRPIYKNVIVDALNLFIEKNGLLVHAWCLMTNHLHLVAKAKETFQWAYILREFKRLTSKEVLAALSIETEPECRREWLLQRFQSPATLTKRTGQIHFWQDGNHPLYLETGNPEIILDRISYVHDNPVRDLVVDAAEAYIYSSAKDYAGKKGLVNVSVYEFSISK